MARKPSILDRVIRSSHKPNEVIKNAFDKLPHTMLPKFVEVGFDSYVLKNTLYSGVSTRKLSEFSGLSLPSALRGVSNTKLFYFSLGILKREQELLANFVKLEKAFEYCLLQDDYEKAMKVLLEIEKVFGSSFWTENNKISLHYLLNSKAEYIVSDELKNNNLVSVLLNNQTGVASNIFSKEDLISEFIDCFQDVEKNDINEALKYKITGFHPNITLKPFIVLASEINGTLIDFYKVFEFISVKSLFESDLADIKKDGLLFLESLGHEITKLNTGNDIDLSEYESELEIVDLYSTSDYSTVCDKLSVRKSFDIGLVNIQAKALAYEDLRCIPRNLSDKIVNLLADIYRKNSNYTESKNILSNICCAFKSNVTFLALTHIIHVESDANTSSNSSAINLCPIYFSNLPTPFKLSLVLGIKESIEIYSTQRPYGSTFGLFKKLADFGQNQTVPDNLDHRSIKYFSKKLVEFSRVDEALALYESMDFDLDCTLKKDYLYTLAMSENVLQAADYFLHIIQEHEQAIEYFTLDLLHEKLLQGVNTLKSIVVPLTLFKYRLVQNTSLNKNATAISIARYIRSTGNKVPSDLGFDNQDHRCVEFLEHVCNRDLLVKSMLFRYQKDAYDERIKICNLLSSRKLSNVDKLIFESKELSKKKVLESAAKQVSSSKVYADRDYVRTNTWDEFSEDYDEFIDINSINEDLEKQLELASKHFDASKKSTNFTNSLVGLISRQLSSYLHIGDNKKAKNLFSMIKCVVEEYNFGLKGLNGYLSTRVRHGTLSSTLLGPTINDGVVSEDEITEGNELIELVSGIEKPLLERLLSSQKKFNSEIASIVNNLRDVTIQITANGKGSDENAFNYNIEPQDVLKIQKSLSDSPTINECWDKIDLWINEKTNDGCKRVQNEIDTIVSDRIANAINAFELQSSRIISESEEYCSNEFLLKLTKARQSIFSQLTVIRSWFNIDYSIVEQEYSFDVVTDIAETMLRSNYLNSDESPNITVSHKFLSSMVDIIYNLLSNAIKHSTIERKKLKISIEATENKDNIIISMINNTEFLGDINIENKKLGKYTSDFSFDDLKILLQKEGGTGVAKIASILKHELNSNGHIELKYIDKNKFYSAIEVSKSCGITLNEHTNS